MKKIADLRKQKGGMTQKKLAEELNVTQAAVSLWENNQLKIYGRNLIKLAEYFDVSADDLLGIEDR